MWISKKRWEWLRDQMLWAKDQTMAYETRYQADRQRRISQTDELRETQRDNRELRDELRRDTGLHAAAIREADLLRVRVNTLEIERATYLTHLIPKLKLSVPQLGHLDVSLGSPGSDFDDLGEQAGTHGDHLGEVPLQATTNRDTISDMIGDFEDPEEARGTVVDSKRNPEA